MPSRFLSWVKKKEKSRRWCIGLATESYHQYVGRKDDDYGMYVCGYEILGVDSRVLVWMVHNVFPITIDRS